MKKTLTGKIMLLTSLVLVCALALGFALPASADFGGNMVINGTFTGGTTSWTNATLTGSTRPWVYNNNQVELTSTSGTRTAYISQCIEILNDNGGENFQASATITGGSVVQFDFFADTTCGLIDTGDTIASIDSETPMPLDILAAPAAHAVLVTAICPISALCTLDNVSLLGESATAVQVASLNAYSAYARPQTGWVLPVSLLAILLTGALVTFWQARRKA